MNNRETSLEPGRAGLALAMLHSPEGSWRFTRGRTDQVSPSPPVPAAPRCLGSPRLPKEARSAVTRLPPDRKPEGLLPRSASCTRWCDVSLGPVDALSRTVKLWTAEAVLHVTA